MRAMAGDKRRCVFNIQPSEIDKPLRHNIGFFRISGLWHNALAAMLLVFPKHL